MVKRKADQSLDEWLLEGELAAAERRVNTHVDTQPDNPFISAATESVVPPTVEEPSAVAPITEEVSQEEAGRWFWSLLGQVGFELW